MSRFVINPQRSRVWVEARSSLHPIRSESTGLEGWFEADMLGEERINPAITPRAHLELPVAALSSGNSLFDREMLRRVDARRYPFITGDLTAMKETDRQGRYLVAGELTFHGKTREYEDEMSLARPEERTLVLEGARDFDIRDFDMDPPKILMLRVHPEVMIKVQIVAERED